MSFEKNGFGEKSKSSSKSSRNENENYSNSSLFSQESSDTRNRSRGNFTNFMSCFASFQSISSSMATRSTASSNPIKSDDTSEQSSTDNVVRVNVYGLTTINQVIRYTGVGVYHSGVEIYNQEWAYGGYPYPVCSIFKMKKPRDLESLSDINGRFQFVQTIIIGRTQFTPSEVKTIIKNLGRAEWIGTNYHLLYRNCNDFSNELCKILCNRSIPPWVNRLASIFANFPFLIRMIPEEYFTPKALQNKLKREQTLKYRISKSVLKVNGSLFEKSQLQVKSTSSNSSCRSEKSTNIIEKSILMSPVHEVSEQEIPLIDKSIVHSDSELVDNNQKENSILQPFETDWKST